MKHSKNKMIVQSHSYVVLGECPPGASGHLLPRVRSLSKHFSKPCVFHSCTPFQYCTKQTIFSNPDTSERCPHQRLAAASTYSQDGSSRKAIHIYKLRHPWKCKRLRFLDTRFASPTLATDRLPLQSHALRALQPRE